MKKQILQPPQMTIISAFDLYRKSVLNTDVDINFWEWLIAESVKNLKNDHTKQEKLFGAILGTYDYSFQNFSGLLKVHPQSVTIEKSNLHIRQKDFMNWIMNLSFVKIYNSLEILLYHAIQINQFPHLKNSLGDKKVIANIKKEISQHLKANSIIYDTKNNRHLVEYIKALSPNYNNFLNAPVRDRSKTTWSNFFELLSIIRHIVVHDGMTVNKDVENNIKALGTDIFAFHFGLVKDEFEYNNLYTYKEHYASLISTINGFALNTIKFLFDEDDFSFINMN